MRAEVVEREKRLPFGELALLKELVTRDQLDEVLHVQASRRGQLGKNQKIATLFVRQGILSRDQAKQVLKIQRLQGPIAGYQLVEHLGTGGMGAVFRAIDADGREVALKILPPSATKNDRFRARFLREAAVSQQLDHKNLVKSFAQGESDEHLYFAMELVPGQNAREIVRRRGALPEPEVRALLRQIAEGMAHYWQRRVVHRDIKPENILVTPEGVAKLTDLGLCRQLDDATQLTRAGKTLGTPLYISPELARGLGSVDVRSDIYSLGATFYHLACGVPPFDAAAPAEMLKAHVEQAPAPARLKNARVSEGMEQLLQRLLEKRPEKRPQDPEAILAALDRMERGLLPFAGDGAALPAPPALEMSQDFDVSDDIAISSSDDLSGSALIPAAALQNHTPEKGSPAAAIPPPPIHADTEVSLDELGSWSESNDLTDSDLADPESGAPRAGAPTTASSSPPTPSSAATAAARVSPARAPAQRPDSDRRAQPPPPAVRPGTTARRPQPLRSGSSATRVAAYAPRRRGSPLAPLASALGFALLFGLGVFLGTRARTPASARQPDPQSQPEAHEDPTLAIEAAQLQDRKNPDDPAGSVERWSALVERIPAGSPGAQAARTGLAGAKKRLEEQADRAVEALDAGLAQLVEARRWSEVEARLQAFPETWRGTPAWERYEELKAEVEKIRGGGEGKKNKKP